MPDAKILVSAGEASGDLYAAQLVERLRARHPGAEFFGCTGPRMREAGVRTVVDAQSLAVVGLVEVVAHIPRIYGEFRKLVRAAEAERPTLAILTDSPDFHLRLAKKLKALGIPVIYLVAPQVWAWRKGRLKPMRRLIDRLLCIFPFEEAFFRKAGIAADFIGHPLTRSVRPKLTKGEFYAKHKLPEGRPLIVMLPGSRRGEAARHMPILAGCANRLPGCSIVVAASSHTGGGFFRTWTDGTAIQVMEGETTDAIAHADLALAASGTVTVEAALLGTPMVTFYRVTGLSWLMGRFLVDVPFYCMVNLIAGKEIVPELMQEKMTSDALAGEVNRLLGDPDALRTMKQELQSVRDALATAGDPIDRAADLVAAVAWK